MSNVGPRAGRVSAALVLSLAMAAGVAACGGESGSPVSGSPTPGAYSPIKADAKIALSLRMGSRVEPVLNAALTKASFAVDSRFADTGEDQDRYVGMLLDAKPAVLVLEAVDADKLKGRLEQAEKAGVVVIAATALPKDDATIDYYVGADPKLRGEAQAETLLSGTTGRRMKGAQRVEVLAGRFDDAAAKIQYDAAIAKIKPRLDDKSVEMPSGGADFGKASVGSPGDAKGRMASLLKDTYDKEAPEGVIAASDAAALGVADAVAEAKRAMPYVVGAGSSVAGVQALMQGRLGATTWDDPAALGKAIAQLVTDLKGKDRPVTDKTSISTGKRDVGTRMLAPVTVVTRGNAKTLFANDADLKKLTG